MKINPIFYIPKYQNQQPMPLYCRQFLACTLEKDEFVSFQRKKKKPIEKGSVEYAKNELAKQFLQKGCSKSVIDSILSDEKKYKALESFLKSYNEGKISFYRPPREREIALLVDSNIDLSNTERLLRLCDKDKEKRADISRALKTKEAICAIENGFDDNQCQRLIEFSDGYQDGKKILEKTATKQVAVFMIKNGFSNLQASVFLRLIENVPYMDIKSLVTSEASFNRFLYLTGTEKKEFRPLSDKEAVNAQNNGFTDEEIKHFVQLRDLDENQNPLLSRQASVQEASNIVKEKLDNHQADVYLRLKDAQYSAVALKCAKIRELADRFCALTKEARENNLSRTLSDKEAANAVISNYQNDKIQSYIDLKDSGLGDGKASFIVNSYFKYRDIEDIEELKADEKRELLQKIMKHGHLDIPDEISILGYKIIPKNIEEYCTIVPSLANSLGISTKEISNEDKKTCLDEIFEFIKKVEGQNEDVGETLEKIIAIIFENKEKINTEELQALKNIVLDPDFNKLQASDKRCLVLAGILNQLLKNENKNTEDVAFEAFYTIQKLNLEEEVQLKIYELIKMQNWLQKIIYSKEEEQNAIIQDIAFDSRHSNTFELLKIFSRAIYFSKNKAQEERFNNLLDKYAEMVEKYLNRLQTSQIFLPQTRIPKASKLKGGQIKEADGVKNSVLYMTQAESDLSLYGFEEGTTKENFKALVHGFDNETQMTNFSTFSLIDTDALLSASYMNPSEYRVFRQQGFILDVNSEDIHAGYFKDFGSGTKKDLESLKEEYLFYDDKKENRYFKRDKSIYRNYISDLIKEKMKIKDEQYLEHIKKIKNAKSVADIEKADPDFKKAIEEAFEEMEFGKKSYDRQYNEILVSKPKIQAVFAYDRSYEEIPLFLRKYAQDNDLSIIIFN